MATVLLTRQREDHEFRAKYVRGDVPVPVTGPITLTHTLPAGSSVELLPDGLTARIHAGDTVGTGQVRGQGVAAGQTVEAVLDVEIVGGAIVAEFVSTGPPVDE